MQIIPALKSAFNEYSTRSKLYLIFSCCASLHLIFSVRPWLLLSLAISNTLVLLPDGPHYKYFQYLYLLVNFWVYSGDDAWIAVVFYFTFILLNPDTIHSQFTYFIDVEAIIAAGKLGLCTRLLQELRKAGFTVDFVKETVNLELLGLFYNDPCRWALTFQQDVFVRRIKPVNEALKKKPEVLIVERSILSDTFFATMLAESVEHPDQKRSHRDHQLRSGVFSLIDGMADGSHSGDKKLKDLKFTIDRFLLERERGSAMSQLEFQTYVNCWQFWRELSKFTINEVVYLDTNVDDAMKRYESRKTPEEIGKISREYQVALKRQHDMRLSSGVVKCDNHFVFNENCPVYRIPPEIARLDFRAESKDEDVERLIYEPIVNRVRLHSMKKSITRVFHVINVLGAIELSRVFLFRNMV